MGKTKEINKKKVKVSNIRYLAISAILAALITVMTAYVCHIPVGATGDYIHFGDSLIYLAAALLPTPYALLAAAVGGGLADLLTAPVWAPATIIIKMLISLPFTSKKDKIITPRNVIATVLAFLISSTGYFVARLLMFGAPNEGVTIFLYLQSVAGSAIQSGGSAICFIIFGVVLDKVGIKRRFLQSK